MRQIADQEFHEQCRTFALRATCDSCAHFDPEAEVCGEGYPSDEHRHLPVAVGDVMCFCKMFELS
ncbi:MAG TPA: hypothetical protein VHM70_12910 [Polyangiaceae bacterium]|jgi:hypothetical protein|nr:hypothetical protein [Polyangiaceae bacterium]